MVMYIYNPTNKKIEAGGYTEFEASMDYRRPCL